MERSEIVAVDCAIYVDAGATNTRAWLARNGEVLSRATAAVGVRDSARDGSPARLHSALRDLIARVRAEADSRHTNCVPSRVVAAGMITSSLGLVEVPHLPAPAGYPELSANLHTCRFPEITHLPILLIPGVRSGAAHCSMKVIGCADVIRGEESLCMGLLARGRIGANSTLLNLGSHWKGIRLDGCSRIQSSITSLAGEMIHSVQAQTILASALPSEPLAVLDEQWLDAGMNEQRRSGLARALFCIRLLEQRTGGLPEQRLAFLVGAFVAADLDALAKRGFLNTEQPVTIVGAGATAEAWRYALQQASMRAEVIPEADAEAALLTGLQWLAGGGTKD